MVLLKKHSKNSGSNQASRPVGLTRRRTRKRIQKNFGAKSSGVKNSKSFRTKNSKILAPKFQFGHFVVPRGGSCSSLSSRLGFGFKPAITVCYLYSLFIIFLVLQLC
jgi:hypothetical protein